MNESYPQQRSLVSRLQRGEALALGELLESRRPYVRVVMRSVIANNNLGGNGEESDLIQEALLQASKNAKAFRGRTLEEWLGWVRQISLRTSYQYMEANRRQAVVRGGPFGCESRLVSQVASPSECAIRGETAAQMAVALGRLPEEMQEVLLARIVENLDHAEIAQQMGRTPGAIRMLYLRALKRLREVWLTEFSSEFGTPA